MGMNLLIPVQSYVSDQALPELDNSLEITKTFDSKFKNWDRLEDQYGQRGQTYQFKKPTRFNVEEQLEFDPTTTGFYQEQYMTVTANLKRRINYQTTDEELATYKPSSILATNLSSAISRLGMKIESDSANFAANAGYRFFGNPIIQPNQLQSVGEVTDAVAVFRTFGGMDDAQYIMPFRPAASIIQSALQQFSVDRNNRVADAGEIGQLGGVSRVTFRQSNLLGTHTSGTITTTDIGINQGTGFTIDSIVVTPPGITSDAGLTTITLSGVTVGATILANDLVEVKPVAGSGPLNFLNYTSYDASENPVQGRVVADATAAGGTLTFQIVPAWIYDGTETDVSRNLTRDIIVGGGGDTLVVAESHRFGLLYFGSYIKFANPRLPTTSPFPSHSEMTDDSAVSLRCYHGHIIGSSLSQMVHDTLTGYGAAPEGCARLIFPLTKS